MKNRAQKRTLDDIRTIMIDASPRGFDGWKVGIKYHDGGTVEFSIDYGNGEIDMLQSVADCIKRVLRESGK